MLAKLNVVSLFSKKTRYKETKVLKPNSIFHAQSSSNKTDFYHIDGKSIERTKSEDECCTFPSPCKKQRAKSPEKCDLTHCQMSSVGLDEVVRERKEKGILTSNVVHIETPGGKRIEQVYDGVHTGRVLGAGVSGIVRLVTHSRTGINYAVKCLDLGLIAKEESVENLKREISIMSELDHPLITRLVEVYETRDKIYLIQDICCGGELFDRLDEQPDYHYTEKQCAFLVKQMLSAIRYMHSKGITHRDLKLENFLFSTGEKDSKLKLIDFGLSKHFTSGETLHDQVGTPYTVAPEVLKGSHDERCDLWAIGVITYLLLSGEPPFGGCGGPEPLSVVKENILNGKFEFEPREIWSNVSQNAKYFIKSLLVTDPRERPTAREAQMSPWLKQWNVQDIVAKERNKLDPNTIEAITSFAKRSALQRIISEVISFSLVPEQIQDLSEDFEKMDTDGSGMISLQDFRKALTANMASGKKRKLKEKEVVEIFNAMHIWNSENHIQWHEFIAAVLSQKLIDERNASLSFERLDYGHKGYITFDDLLDLMGSNGLRQKHYYKKIFTREVSGLNCKDGKIFYEDFLQLMKLK